MGPYARVSGVYEMFVLVVCGTRYLCNSVGVSYLHFLACVYVQLLHVLLHYTSTQSLRNRV